MADALQKILDKLVAVDAGSGVTAASVTADVNEEVEKSDVVAENTHDAEVQRIKNESKEEM